MTYLVAYLALGAVVLAVALISDRRANPPQSDFAREMLEAIDPERATLRYKLMDRLVVPALAGILMLVAWPVAVFIKVRELAAPKPAEAESCTTGVLCHPRTSAAGNEHRGNRGHRDGQRPAGCGSPTPLRPS